MLTRTASRKINVSELVSKALEVLAPLGQYRHACHAASLAVVKAGLADRVARGFCKGVGGQHSWAVVGWDCYDRDALIVDPTLWSYTEREPIRVDRIASRRSASAPRERIDLDEPLSDDAKLFLEVLGPLDLRGWQILSGAPVEGWPAGEIFAGAALDRIFDFMYTTETVGQKGLTADRPMGEQRIRRGIRTSGHNLSYNRGGTHRRLLEYPLR